MPGIYRHAVGMLLEVRLPAAPLEGATLRGKLRKPDGSSLRKAVTATGAVVSYTTVAGDLDQVGQYAFSVVVLYASTGKEYTADPLFFRIWPTDRHGSV